MAGEPIKAYILVNTELGKEEDILKEASSLGNNSGVSIISSDLVFGEFDLVIVVSGDSVKKIDKFVTKLRRLDGVLKTMTLIATSPFE
jgi:uncharacterized protein with GYD domain